MSTLLMFPAITSRSRDSVMSAAVFERFRRHDWAQDVNFLMGLANIQQKWAPEGLSPAQLKERVQQVQAFYFDKCACLITSLLSDTTLIRYVERLDYAAFLADEAKRQEDLLFERFLSHDFAGDARYQSLVGDLVSKLRDGGQHAADQIDKEITLFKCTYFSECVSFLWCSWPLIVMISLEMWRRSMSHRFRPAPWPTPPRRPPPPPTS